MVSDARCFVLCRRVQEAIKDVDSKAEHADKKVREKLDDLDDARIKWREVGLSNYGLIYNRCVLNLPTSSCYQL